MHQSKQHHTASVIISITPSEGVYIFFSIQQIKSASKLNFYKEIMMMKKYSLILSVLFVSLVSVFAAGSKEKEGDNSLEYIQSKGTFVLGLDDSFPPFGFRNENNEIVGFDIDVAREVCKRLKVELVLQPIDWDAKEAELATKQIDCIWNGFTVTDERRKVLTFSDSYVNNAQAVVVLDKSPYKTLADLAGRTIGIQGGSSAADAIEETPSFKSSIRRTVEFNDNLTAIMDLEIGGCDAVVMDLLVAVEVAKTKPIRILSETLAKEEYAVGFRLGEIKLAEAVNEQMRAMAADGTMASIATKWLGADITTIGK